MMEKLYDAFENACTIVGGIVITLILSGIGFALLVDLFRYLGSL